MVKPQRGATYNTNVGTFTNATVAVDAYGAVQGASQGSATVSASTVTQAIMNTTGASLTKGQVVYFNSSTTFGTTPTVSLSIANNKGTTLSAGLVTATVANNATGTILVQGLMTGLNTLNLTQGAAVYVSATTAGGWVSAAPTAPNYQFRVGYCSQSDLTNGAIYVTPSTGRLGDGTVNQVLGISTTDATLQEMKTISGDTNVTVTNSPGLIVLGLSSLAQSKPIEMVPPIGYSLPPVGITSTSTATPTYQQTQFNAIDIGSVPWTADAVVFNLSAAYTGATIPTFYVGLYASDPLTGYPLTSNLLGTGNLPLSGVATGIKSVAFGSAVTLSPNIRYWVATLLAGSAVTTAGTFTLGGAQAISIPLPPGIAPGSITRGLALSSQTALPTTATSSSSFSLGSAPVLATLRRSA